MGGSWVHGPGKRRRPAKARPSGRSMAGLDWPSSLLPMFARQLAMEAGRSSVGRLLSQNVSNGVSTSTYLYAMLKEGFDVHSGSTARRPLEFRRS